MKKIKVIHLLMTDKYSGAEKIAIDIISKCSDIDAIYVAKEGPVRKILSNKNINFILLKKINVSALNMLIKKIKPDIIHCHDFRASLLGTCFYHKVHVISHIHQNPNWIKKINAKSILYLLSLNRYDQIISVSNSVFEEFLFTKSIKRKEVIGNIVDIDEISKYYNANIKKDIDVLFVGRLSPEKNPLMCLQVFQKLYANNKMLRFAMVGDGCLYEECKNYLKNNKLDDCVELLGFQSEVYTIMNRAKIAINTSKWEGFGLSVVESLALGLPVVCSNVGGLKNIITHRCGKLCDSVDDFVIEITKLLTNYDYYTKKSKEAIIRAKEFNNVKGYCNRLNNIYNNIIEKRKIN